MFTVKCQEWLIDFVDISISFIIFKFLLQVKTWQPGFSTQNFLVFFSGFSSRIEVLASLSARKLKRSMDTWSMERFQRSFFKPFSKILGPKAGWVLAENSPKNSGSMAQRKTQLFSQVF